MYNPFNSNIGLAIGVLMTGVSITGVSITGIFNEGDEVFIWLENPLFVSLIKISRLIILDLITIIYYSIIIIEYYLYW